MRYCFRLLSLSSENARICNALFNRKVYAVGFAHPVLREGDARIRAQMSAGHARQNVMDAIEAFAAANRAADEPVSEAPFGF